MTKDYKTDYVHIEYISDADIIRINWLKNTLHEDYRAVFEQMLALAVAHKCYFWLFDQQEKNGVTLPQDLEWLNQEFIPHAIKSMGGSGGYIAIVLSKSIFAQMSSKKIAQYNAELIQNRVFDLQYFSEASEAIIWLKNQQTA